MGSLPAVHHGADPRHPPRRLHLPGCGSRGRRSSRSGESLPAPSRGWPLLCPRHGAPSLLGRPDPALCTLAPCSESRRGWPRVCDPAGAGGWEEVRAPFLAAPVAPHGQRTPLRDCWEKMLPARNIAMKCHPKSQKKQQNKVEGLSLMTHALPKLEEGVLQEMSDQSLARGRSCDGAGC